MTQWKCTLTEAWRVAVQLGCTFQRAVVSYSLAPTHRISLAGQTKKDNNTRAFEPLPFPLRYTVVSFAFVASNTMYIVFRAHNALLSPRFFFVFFCFVLSSCLFHLHVSKSVVTLIPQLVDVEWVSVFVFGWCSFAFASHLFQTNICGCAVCASFYVFLRLICLFKVFYFLCMYACFSNNWAEKRNRSIFFSLLCVK